MSTEEERVPTTEEACPASQFPWHDDPGDPRYSHCCPAATAAWYRRVTHDGTFSVEEGLRLNILSIKHNLGLIPSERPPWYTRLLRWLFD